MNYNPNSKKHKAMHGGYRTKPTKSQVQATLNFFDTSDVDFSKMVAIVATSGEGKPRLGTQLEFF
jgi:hypothetical protein